DAGPADGHHAQRLATLPDAGLPNMGSISVLSGEWRIRVPRSATGWHGIGGNTARPNARTSAEGRGTPVRRGRRTTLVVAILWPGRSHTHLGRPRLAGLQRRPIRGNDRRYRRARRDDTVPGGPNAASGRGRQLLPPHGRRPGRDAFRARRQGARSQPRARQPWSAADRDGRLE